MNPEHPVGKDKAKVFELLLGLTIEDAVYLQDKILKAVQIQEAIPTWEDEYGQRYVVEFEMEANGHRCIILTSWILKEAELCPRMTSCYIK